MEKLFFFIDGLPLVFEGFTKGEKPIEPSYNNFIDQIGEYINFGDTVEVNGNEAIWYSEEGKSFYSWNGEKWVMDFSKEW